MDKRFQVFVSSTYEDLWEERAVVISALLQMDCFPAGMELFPASDQDSWSLIKSVIDDSDYYLVILGGRYGSVSESAGRGYTHLEYEYAVTMGKPTMALVHANPRSLPGEKIEQNDEGRRRFDGFRAELRQENCRHWSNLSELTAGVFSGLLHLKKTRPAVGWIRSTDSGDEQLKDELLSVRRELEAAKPALQELRKHGPPPHSEKLAKGRERTEIAVAYPDHILHFECNWAQVISCLLPLTPGGGADEDSVHTALFSLAKDNPCLEFRSGVPEEIGPPFCVLKSSVGRVMNQLVALGFIEGFPILPARAELCGELLRTERGRVVSWLLTLPGETRIPKPGSQKSGLGNWQHPASEPFLLINRPLANDGRTNRAPGCLPDLR